MPDVTIKVDTREFQRALKQYREVSRRGLAEDINQKAYSVMISAVALTKRGSKQNVRAYMHSASRKNPDVEVAPILINWFRGGGGRYHKAVGRGPGLYGQEMREKVSEYIRQQADSINFLRAGWLSAVAIFARAIGKAPGQNATKFLARFGFGKYGGAEIAKPGFNPTASFYNMAFSRWTSTKDGVRFAEEGLAKSIAQEVRRIGEYIAGKMQKRSDELVQRFLKF